MPPRLREPGEFCWINIISPDLDGTRAFFSALLGWRFPEMPGMGYLIEVDGHRQGGLFDLRSPGNPAGQQPVIGVMVRVTDADAMAARMNALGGTALPPMEVGTNGRMVVGHDPSGANIDLWELRSAPPGDVDGAVHGAMSWFEHVSDDLARDTKFYCDLFGWTFEVMRMPGFDYVTFKQVDTFTAGMMARTPEMGDLKPFWCTYFTVDDVERAAQQAETLGGTLALPISEAPGVGRFCGIISPQGVGFCVMQYSR